MEVDGNQKISWGLSHFNYRWVLTWNGIKKLTILPMPVIESSIVSEFQFSSFGGMNSHSPELISGEKKSVTIV